MSVRSLVATASAAVLLFACGNALADGPPPAAAFGRIPALETAEISPDGKHLILLGANADQKVVNIIGIDDQKVTTLPLADLDGTDVSWADDGHALVQATFLQKWREDPKHVYHYSRDIILTPEGKVTGRLLGDSDASNFITSLPIVGMVDGDKPAAMVIGLDWSVNSIQHAEFTRLRTKQEVVLKALWRADSITGKGSLIERGNQFSDWWWVDLKGEPRIRMDSDISHVTTFLGRAKGSGTYKTLFRAAHGEDDRGMLGYSDPEDAAYMQVDQPDGTMKVVRRSLADGSETVVGPKAAVRSVGVKWDDRRLAPVALIDGDHDGRYEWLDPEIGGIHAGLSKAFKGKYVWLANWSRDRKRFVIRVEGDDSAPNWFLFDAAKGEVSPIQGEYPELSGAALGAKSYFTYKAADGLEIPAYLTLPPGAAATGGKLPLVVMPHGGPSARDHAGFDFLAQFVATRGYVVLQPQFRGSAGFGTKFEKAGNREWGGKMQTDLLDGIKDLAARGVIDPNRVCIVGWSFGGYAALAGATLHPEAYKCAASINGISDLPLLIGEATHDYGQKSDAAFNLKDLIGDAAGEQALLQAQSPILHVDHVRAPILLVAGTEDTVVPYEQTAHMKQALEDSGKTVQLISFAGDDHYLHTSKDRIAMMEALEKFLAKNLPIS